MKHQLRAWPHFALIVALACFIPACTGTKKIAHDTHQTNYPAHWWAPVSKEGAPSWEVFPQEAGPGEVILSKRNELGLLSNFAATPFVFHGKRYASLEGFWQMMKFPEGPDDPRAKFPGLTWSHTRDEVAQMTAFDAKRAGTEGEQNMKKMGITWVTFEGKQIEYRPKEPGEHYRLIVEATRAKVQQNPEVRKVLLATGDLILKPDHHQEPNPPAAWRYYDILMQIRKEMQKHQIKLQTSNFSESSRGREICWTRLDSNFEPSNLELQASAKFQVSNTKLKNEELLNR